MHAFRCDVGLRTCRFSVGSFAAPILIGRAGPSTRIKFVDFFRVPIRNVKCPTGKSIEGVVSCGLLDFLLCSVGDLNPLSGFYFPLFSMMFPSEIAIRVENGGFSRKQNCCKLLQIYVQLILELYPIKIAHPVSLSSWSRSPIIMEPRKTQSIVSRSA